MTQVSIPGEDRPFERSFTIRIKWAATVDIQAVLDFVGWAPAPDVGAALCAVVKHSARGTCICSSWAQAFNSQRSQ